MLGEGSGMAVASEIVESSSVKVVEDIRDKYEAVEGVWRQSR
jgi:hypothetical protein